MLTKLRYYYILLFISIIFIDLIFPIPDWIPYVKGLIVANLLVLLLVNNYKKPRRLIIFFLYLVVLFFISTILSTKLYDFLYRDLANIILLMSFSFVFFSSIQSKIDFLKFKSHMFYTIWLLSCIVSVLGLYKFIVLTTTGSVPSFAITTDDGMDKFRLGTSLVGDYNYYALGLFIGLSVIPYIYKIKAERIKLSYYKIILPLSFLLISVNILFSSSRRGVLILFFYLTYLLFQYLFKKRNTFKSKLKFVLTVSLFLISSTFVATYVNQYILGNQSSYELSKLLDRMATSSDIESLGGQRFLRFNKAFEMYSTYSPVQKLFGNGFDYLEEIGEMSRFKEDYPHNILISALLYGGIVSFLLTLLIIIFTFKLYFDKGLEYRTFFIWYIIGVLMLMASKNSLFSVQFIFLLFLLPYINDNVSRLKNINYE